MVVETRVLPFFQWLMPGRHGFGAILTFVLVLTVIGLLTLFTAYLTAALRRGPSAAAVIVFRGFASGLAQLVQISPRRVWAMTYLAVQEAAGRRALLITAVVFIAIVMVGSWYLDPASDQPAKVYIEVVLTSTAFLVQGLALLLSVFSLPTDVRNRTITTVVTKPVRSVEIVLGRILGFSLVGTALVALMALGGYFFVVRGLSHTHTIAEGKIADPDFVPEADHVDQFIGQTNDVGHKHFVITDEEGRLRTNVEAGHWHNVVKQGDSYAIGPHHGMLQARVPIYGRLRFLDRSGNAKDREGRILREGINVGNEWTYHSFIEGNTLATAIWRFEGLSVHRYPSLENGLPLELNLRVFRTYKGIQEHGIPGSIVLKNPNPRRPIESDPIPFVAREFVVDQKFIPRTIPGRVANGPLQDLDLFADFVDEGRLEVWVQCSEGAQYYGMAEPSVYLRAGDRSFAMNFIKGYVSIWLQMVVIVAMGVMFSTFLSSAVALLATLKTIVLGYAAQFALLVAGGDPLDWLYVFLFAPDRGAESANKVATGGGPIEALIRVVRQDNLVSELDVGWATPLVEGVDRLLLLVMSCVVRALPDYRQLGTSTYVAEGYNIPGALMAQHVATVLAFVVALTFAAYYLLKTREISA